ncbi:hypothetical protein ANTRET_LOCUS7020 [Anthophora retusa]
MANNALDLPDHIDPHDSLAVVQYYLSLGVDVPRRPGAPIAVVYEDDHISDIANQVFFPLNLRTLPSMKLNLIRFYKFYFNGILPPPPPLNSSPHQVLFPVIPALPILPFNPLARNELRFFFPDDKFSENAFFSYPPPLAGEEEFAEQFEATAPFTLPTIADPELRRAALALYNIDVDDQIHQLYYYADPLQKMPHRWPAQ